MRIGTGFIEVIAKVTAAEIPPPGEGFTATRLRFPAVAKSAVVNTTLTWVALA